MLRVISYYYKYSNNDEIKERLINLFNLYLKTGNVEIDLYEIVMYVIKYFYEKKDLPSLGELKEKYSDFVFLDNEEEFKDKDDFIDYVKKIYEEYKKKYKVKLLNDLMCNINEGEKSKRIEIIEKLMSLENEVVSSDIKEISEYRASEILLNNNTKGINTGVKELDELLKVGILEGKIFTIVAPPGCFKTSFSLNMSYNEIMNYNNSNVLFISAEIPKDELFLKFLVRHSYVVDREKNMTFISIRERMVDLNFLDKVEKDFSERKKSNLYIVDVNDFSIDSLYMFKSYVSELIDKYNIKSIYVDYIQLLMDLKPKFYSDVREWGNAVVGAFRLISVEKNCRVIILSQSNAEGINRAEKTGGQFNLTNISELNTIKNHSYYILTLYADDDLKRSYKFKWQLLKYRDGETRYETTQSSIIPQFYYMNNEEGDEFLNLKKVILEKGGEGLNDYF